MQIPEILGLTSPSQPIMLGALFGGQLPALLGIMIPIIAIVLGIGLAIVSAFLNYKRRKDMFALYHQERMAAIEKGVELPPLPESFFGDETKIRSPRRFLRCGL